MVNKKKLSPIRKVVFVFGFCALLFAVPGIIPEAADSAAVNRQGMAARSTGLDPSQQLILEVEKYVGVTRELNVATMMFSRIEQDSDPQSAAYHALEGLSRLLEIPEKMQKSWNAIRKQEEILSRGVSGEVEPMAKSGPNSDEYSGFELWSTDDWLTNKALDGLPELAQAAKKIYADSRLKLKIYAVYLVSNACPKEGRNGDHERCYDPKGVRVCCNLKNLVRNMQTRFEEPYKYKGDALCTNDEDKKQQIILELTTDIDNLDLADLQYVVREQAAIDAYWAEQVKEAIVVGAGEITEAGAWDYLNSVKDTFFKSFSSAWDKTTKVGGGVTTVASGDYLPMAFVTERGPAACNHAWAMNPELPRGLAILAPKDKKKAPRIIALLEFHEGRAVIPYTLQGVYDLYLFVPGHLPLLHKNVNIEAKEQDLFVNPVPAGGSETVSLELSPDWDPLKESTLQLPACPPCDEEEEEGVTFRIRNTGNLDSQGYMYNYTATTNAEFSLFLPEGESETEVEVTYPVRCVLESTGVAPPNRIVSISPSSYTLNTLIRWRVEKFEKSDGVTEYLFSGEAVHHDTQEINVAVDTGSSMDPIMKTDFAGVPAPADQLLDPMSFTVRQGPDVNEFPFVSNRKRSDGLPQGFIGTQGSTRNRYGNTFSVEISGGNQE